MERFLGGCKAALEDPLPTNQRVHVVLGNEACDLDSTVSALALAYFLAQTSLEAKAALTVPVLNIPWVDFPLRSESTFLLQAQGIHEGSLIFRDEIDLLALHRAGRLSLTLVDHHVLPRKDAALEEAVTEVIDHRPLERQRAPPCRVTAEPVGSCATLVAERILQHPAPVLDRQTATLLHGTIVLDCVNMAPEAGKVTPKDTHYVSLLESTFPDLPPRSAIFEALQEAKFNVSGLSTEQMLRKDLKDLSGKEATLALSALYVDLQAFLLRPSLEQELHLFCRGRGYAALLAMAISFDEGHVPFRQLAVYSPQAELRDAVCRALEASRDPCLDLRPRESPLATLRAYDQGNAAASRKKVLPVVRAFLSQRDRGGPPPGGGTAADMQQPQAGAADPPGGREARPEPQGAERRDPEPSRDPKGPARSHHLGDDLADEDSPLPPTPMNSLVDECPLDRGLPKLSAEAVCERFNRIAVVRSSSDGSPQKK